MKMTVTDQIKIFYRKIMQNEALYDLDRKAAKISALSSNNLDKYEYFTGKDLGLKLSTIKQAKFEYFPLGKNFNKELDEDDQKEGLFKRLKNIKDKSEDQSKKQLDIIKNMNISSKPLKTIGLFSTLSDEAKKLMTHNKLLDDWLYNAQLVWTKTDRITKYDFSNFTFSSKFSSKIYSNNLTLQEAEDIQQESEILINKLINDYNPINQIKINEKNDSLNSAHKLFFSI